MKSFLSRLSFARRAERLEWSGLKCISALGAVTSLAVTQRQQELKYWGRLFPQLIKWKVMPGLLNWRQSVHAL